MLLDWSPRQRLNLQTTLQQSDQVNYLLVEHLCSALVKDGVELFPKGGPLVANMQDLLSKGNGIAAGRRCGRVEDAPKVFCKVAMTD